MDKSFHLLILFSHSITLKKLRRLDNCILSEEFPENKKVKSNSKHKLAIRKNMLKPLKFGGFVYAAGGVL